MVETEVVRVKIGPTGLISRSETAKALGLRPKTLCEWAAKGLGPRPIKIGGRVFYAWSAVLAFISCESD